MHATLERPTRKPTSRAILFSLYAPHAHSVFLAGDFNDWSPNTVQMLPGTDGTWLATLHMKPGFHEYKFVVDGQWTCGGKADHTTPDADSQKVDNEFGSCNHVLRI